MISKIRSFIVIFSFITNINALEVLSIKNNLISFLSSNFNKSFKGPGISSKESLDLINHYVEDQNFIEALKLLWSEKNPIIRIDWLLEKANEGYPLFMFELSNELIKLKNLDPNINLKVKTEISNLTPLPDVISNMVSEYYIPEELATCASNWYALALYRLMQDIACLNLSNVEKPAIQFFSKLYIHSLEVENRRNSFIYAYNALKTWTNFPSPSWIAHSWMPDFDLRFLYGLVNLKPKDDWEKIRNNNLIEIKLQIESTYDFIFFECSNCLREESETHKLLRCSRCKKAFYCNVECQKQHRKIHKHDCKKEK